MGDCTARGLGCSGWALERPLQGRDPLSRHLCKPALVEDPAKDHSHRSAHLLRMSGVFIIGPPEYGCSKVIGGLRVNKPIKELVWALLTAVGGYDSNGEPLYSEVITRGGDDGVDKLAQAWADKHMIPHTGIPANVASFGKVEAEKRQIAEILDMAPSCAISFKSKHTDAFMKKLGASGLLIFEVQLGD